jgi:asparagine synthase (glutamine-hydrolysing)
MSGIAGIINLDGAPVDPQLLWRMTGSMTRRGPDDQQIWIDGNVGFGHTMLRSTFEADTEKQPLTLNGNVWLTADARIDGRAELISALEAKLDRDLRIPLLPSRIGSFRSPNDSELILFAYEAWDEDCVKHLIGDFAFAIWDKPKRRLFCARDHLGVRQLFYSKGTHSLVFSNSLNSLRLHPLVSDELNDDAIADFLLFGLNQDQTTTVFADIRRLPKAHSLTLSPEHLKTKEYWTLRSSTIRFKTEDQYLEAFKDLLKSAVDDRLRSGRVSVSMSGGMDSSALAATALYSLQHSSMPFDLRAFCVAYDRLFPDREREYAGLVAQTLGIPLEYLEGDIINANDSRGTNAYLRPEPFQIEPFYAVGDELLVRMSEHGRVALTGWDGDTIMNESPKYRYALLLKKFRLARLAIEMAQYVTWRHSPPPIGVRTSLKKLVGQYPPKPPFPVWLNADFASRLNVIERWQRATAEPHLFYTTRPNAFRILSSPNWSALLGRYDSGVTSLPLEVRHPLVDVRVVEYALNLPIIPWVIDKWILRAAMKGVLPEAVRNRPKTPLAAEPALGLARSEKFKQVDEFNPTAASLAFIDRKAVPSIAAETDSNKLWMNARPFILNQWLLHSLPIDRSPFTENKNDYQIQSRKIG